MSNNLEALSRIVPDQPPMMREALITVPVLQDSHRTHITRANAGPTPHSEILKLVHVLFLSSANAPHHVMFCGVDTDDGSGSVCASAARTLASEVSSHVCLVDASGFGSSLQRLLEPDGSFAPPSTSLVQHSSIARQIARNLWLVPAERLTSAGVSKCGAEQICSRLLDLRREFGYLLVDAPPLGADMMASVLGRVTDGVVLVLEANGTRRATARRAKETLEAANIPLLGAVLNNREFPIPEKLYRRL